MKPREMVFRVLAFSLLVSACFFAAQSLRASPPIGAVVQTWNYNPQTNAGTATIVNVSHKDITAYNISIKETYADGNVHSHLSRPKQRRSWDEFTVQRRNGLGLHWQLKTGRTSPLRGVGPAFSLKSLDGN